MGFRSDEISFCRAEIGSLYVRVGLGGVKVTVMWDRDKFYATFVS